MCFLAGKIKFFKDCYILTFSHHGQLSKNDCIMVKGTNLTHDSTWTEKENVMR